MEHHFNVEIAEKYGINAAILLNNISFWILKNQAEQRHFYDGRYWTYASKPGLVRQFPYLSQKQITYALDKLTDDGVLIVGNYNDSPLNHTKWYALTDKGSELVSETAKPRNDKREVSNITFCNDEMTKGNYRTVQKGNILDIYNNIYNTTDRNHKDNKKIYNITDILCKYDIDDDLKKAITEFAKMRKAIKKELTPHALELCIKKLFDMSADKKERVMIVEQSVMNNWQGFYELKDKPADVYADNAMTPTENVAEIEDAFRRAYDRA